MSVHKSWVSPRIQALREEIAQGNIALEAFWQEMKMQGTPLYEPIEGEQEHCLVSFVWRGDERTHNVVLISSLAIYMDGLQFAERQMDHLEGTDLWYRTYHVHKDIHTTYQFSPDDPLVEPQDVNDWLERFANFHPDPFNPLQIVYPRDEEALDSYSGICSIVQGHPQVVDPSALMERTPKGKLEQYRLRSAILQNERRIWMYTPPGYDVSRAQPYGLLLLFDGFDSAHVITPPAIVDTLIATQKIPPLVAVYIDNLGQQVRSRELPCYQPFIEFLVKELMPWLYAHYHVTHDPQKTIISGSSFGGLAAAFAGLQASNTFGNVLAQSGSFWWGLENEEYGEWIIRQFEQTCQLPLRFSLQAGQWEPILPSIRKMRDVLHMKGYPVHYHEYYGGHDDLAWHTLFPIALQELVNDTLNEWESQSFWQRANLKDRC